MGPETEEQTNSAREEMSDGRVLTGKGRQTRIDLGQVLGGLAEQTLALQSGIGQPLLP